MLYRTNILTSFRVHARDGDVGHIDDVLFDDTTGAVRYVVVDTSDWLPGGKVLVPPYELENPDIEKKLFNTQLTREQVENQPPFSLDRPLSRSMESELHRHFGWEPYWVRGPFEGPVPGLFAEQMAGPSEEGRPEARRSEGTSVAQAEDKNPHLRSASELISYNVQAQDGKVGTLSDLVVDDEYWQLRYMIIDTGSWLTTRNVLLATGWIREISWPDSAIDVDLERGAIQDSPEFDPEKPIDRQYEEALYSYYGRRKYWIDRES
jgi:sporulation protein YlmC with PRC-barrel domain